MLWLDQPRTQMTLLTFIPCGTFEPGVLDPLILSSVSSTTPEPLKKLAKGEGRRVED